MVSGCSRVVQTDVKVPNHVWRPVLGSKGQLAICAVSRPTLQLTAQILDTIGTILSVFPVLFSGIVIIIPILPNLLSFSTGLHAIISTQHSAVHSGLKRAVLRSIPTQVIAPDILTNSSSNGLTSVPSSMPFQTAPPTPSMPWSMMMSRLARDPKHRCQIPSRIPFGVWRSDAECRHKPPSAALVQWIADLVEQGITNRATLNLRVNGN